MRDRFDPVYDILFCATCKRPLERNKESAANLRYTTQCLMAGLPIPSKPEA